MNLDERELEQRLRTAVEHAAPDPLDRILASCGPQAPAPKAVPFGPPKKKRRWAPLAAAAVLALVICGGAFGISGWRGANAVDSVVMLDVNPSLSMDVSAQERVLSVTPFNQDAETILGDMDLTGTDLDVAVNALSAPCCKTAISVTCRTPSWYPWKIRTPPGPPSSSST